MDNQETYNIQDAIKAQAKYCEEEGAPHFAPNDGRCWRCHRNIYEKWEREDKGWDGKPITRVSGISVEKAGAELVTGCPHCHRSYCD
jgi:hypothetical protein